jgi:2-dehydro-3-deoxyphosphooctonate aldolase (KDO 8-P synthase)
MNLEVLIAGPCVVENEDYCFQVVEHCQQLAEKYDLQYIFKSSYKKANRTSYKSFTTIGEEKALRILEKVNQRFEVPVLTDVHQTDECGPAAEVADYLQIPAFLCRQTQLIEAAAQAARYLNIKKGQFMAPETMEHAMMKAVHSGMDREQVMITERGSMFGYNHLVVDMTSIPKMQEFNPHIIMDCTHSVQQPNQSSGVTGGNPAMIETMAKSAVAAGAYGLFIETHPQLDKAKSDAHSMLPLNELEGVLAKCHQIDGAL